MKWMAMLLARWMIFGNPNSLKLKKVLTLLLLIVISPVIGGLYGIIHDQLTYTISPEYYTKFKFYQFGLVDMSIDGDLPNPRLLVSVIGFMATWWMGLAVGLILALIGLIHKDHKQMLRITLSAIGITIMVAFVTGLVGLIYGKFYLAHTEVYWWFPENLIDRENFIAVGSMHNFSYIGGLTGGIAGAIYNFRQQKNS